MPKTCPVKEAQKLYWVSNKEFRLVGDVKSEKIPYADCFSIFVMYLVKQNQNNTIEITARFKIAWVKSTILKDTIEKRVSAETIETTNNIVFPSFLDILKSVYNSQEYQSKYPVLQKGGNENLVENNNKESNHEEPDNENNNDELLKKIEVCTKKIFSLEEKIKKNEIILYSFVGVFAIKILYSFISYMFFE